MKNCNNWFFEFKELILKAIKKDREPMQRIFLTA